MARAYPVARSGHEVIIRWQDPALSRGAWTIVDGELALENTQRARNVVLLPESVGGTFLRLRVRGGAGAWVSLLFRVAVHTARPLRLTGYGAALNARKGRLELIRFDEGGVREPGVVANHEVVEGRDEYEICVWHAGANFVATLFDGLTKENLGTVTWSDPSYRDGMVGVQVAGRGSERLRLALSTAPVVDPPAFKRPWLAEQWLVEVSAEQAAAIPERFGAKLRRLRNGPSGTVAFATTEAVVAGLRAAGIALEAVQAGVPFVYRDPGYAARAATPLVPTRVGINFQDGLKDPRLIDNHLRAFADRFPDVTRLEEIGRSIEGRPLLALHIASDPEDANRPVLLLNAAHHANEAITPEFVLDAVRYLLENRREPQVRRWLASLAVVAVPMVNPDGSHAFWHLSDQLGRTNRRMTNPEEPMTSGVDLNRNYPFRWGAVEARYSSRISSSHFFRGEASGSEPEVAAMIRLGERLRPLAVISYHAAATKLLVSYTSGDLPNPDPSVSWMLAEEIVAGLTYSFRGRRYETARNLYAVSGTDQNWYLHSFGSVAYTLEAPVSKPVRPAKIDEAVRNSRFAWQYLLDRWLTGPSLSLHVTRAGTGAPLAATVTIDEITLGAGEVWTSHPETGWYHRYLPDSGTYTLRVADGEKEVVEEITVVEGVAVVEVAL
jgi:hypothetical protein